MLADASELLFAVRPALLAKFFGQLSLLLALLAAAPLAVAYASKEWAAAAGLCGAALAAVAAGFPLSRVKAGQDIRVSEALVLVCALYLWASLLFAAPFVLAGGMDFLDAFFETVSGVTTTGLSTLATVQGMPRSLLFCRAWLQWFGGLGVVVLSLALLVRPGSAAKGLSAADVAQDDLLGGAKAHASRVLTVYILLTAAELCVVLICGAEPFTALLYSLAAVSTGGFAPLDASLGDLPGLPAAWAVTAGCLAGSLPLPFYDRLLRRAPQREETRVQMRVLAMLGAFSVAGLGFVMLEGGANLADTLRHAPLMALSAQTTAGFASMSPADMAPTARLVLILSMLSGGCIGSTAGGFKVFRLAAFFAVLRLVLARSLASPHAVVDLRFGSRRLGDDEAFDALFIICLYMAALACSWLPFLAYGLDPLNSLFDVASALGTVGLSTGIASAHLPDSLKLVLCADMLLGRLEIFAWLVAFSPKTWTSRRM